MLPLLISLIALFIVALLIGLLREKMLRRKLERGEIDEMPTVKQQRPDGCCGKHAVCEKDELLAASLKKKAEYFEDEDLDAYAGTPGDAYSPEVCEQFRHVLYTMKQSEVPAWLRSLQLRGIEVPDELKDEVLLLLED